MPSRVPEGQSRGWIIPIGGAENKENDRRILERFVRVSGGEGADIVVIPTASRVHETGPRYEQVFRALGAARVTVMDFDTRRDCREPGRLKRLEEAGVVERRVYEQHPPRAEYVLTDLGNELRPVLKALFEWGQRHTQYRAVTT